MKSSLDAVNCTNVDESVKALSNCSSFTWKMAYTNNSPGNCSAENYTGIVCRQQLQSWQECAVVGADNVFLDLTFMEQSQGKRERDAAQFLNFYCQLYIFEVSTEAHYQYMNLLIQRVLD